MASKSKSRPPRKKTSPNPIANLGLFEIPDLNDDALDDDGSDIDEATLESQLEALLRGEEPPKRNKPRPKVVPPVLDIDKLAASCLIDDEEDDDDDNLSENEDLMRELQSLSPEECEEEETREDPSKNEKSDVSSSSGSLVCVLEERLNLYAEAVKMAKLKNDTSKARRYERAIKTLENLLKSAKSGAQISEDDIPPIVSIPKLQASTTADIPSKPVINMPESVAKSDDSEKEESLVDSKSSSVSVAGSKSNVNSLLIERREEYRSAALQAKKAGNKDLAIKYMRTAKTFDAVIAAAANNEPVDLTNIPPPLAKYTDSNSETGTQKRAHEQVQKSSAMEIAALEAAKEEDSSEIFAAPPPPSSVLEALQQRLAKYTLTKEAAESEGNTSKARRLQRIVKQYETAIRDLQAGKHVDFEELPTPPGFAPIPVPVVSDKATSDPKPASTATASTKPVVPASEKSKVPHPPVKKPKVQRTNTSTSEKQLEFLLERQKLFRDAALSAKKNGDIQQAKEYLRMSKGFDSMIEATRCGLPIDTTTIPTPPQLETDFVIVGVSDCEGGHSDLPKEELLNTLENELCNQIEVCNRNKEHFLRLGDVQSASKYEKLALESKKDLSVIRHLKKTGDAAPKFHYETRLFSMVICHSELSDNELEVCVERGINLQGKPDDLDSYVKLELPIPSENPQRAKTHTVRNTNNPEFGETFKFEINRKSRSQLRLFKRHSLKLEVWSKGGFLRSDVLLGTCSIKLVDLESKCLIHGSYNLMDGRKTVPGMIEAKVKVREPLLVKQVEEVREKWLVIGS